MILKDPLDPEARDPPLGEIHQPRKRSSLWSFIRWIVITLVQLGVAWVLFGVVGQFVYHWSTFSHTHVYQNQTLSEVKNRGSVVQPLIDTDTAFDIAVSIWTRPLDERERERATDFAETPLYSDIVFRDLHLADKHIKTILEYKLPVAAFRKLLLKEWDLRASFVVLPKSPSLAEHIANFSSWYPDGMAFPPNRAWPFPLGSPLLDSPSIRDLALDAAGISIDLLEFREYRANKCAQQDNHPEEDVDEASIDAEEDGDDDDGPTPGPFRFSSTSDISKHPIHAVERHPFVITRTQIRIVDETHILNRKAFNKEHNRLKSQSCGQNMGTEPDYPLCRRAYLMNGNWENRMELRMPGNKTEWAYGPYLSHGTFSAGPKDVIPIPVTRRDCPDGSKTSASDPAYMDISWQISFTGRSPAKLATTELFPRPQRLDHHESAYKLAKAHDNAELWNGLYGHRFNDDAHPRRRFAIDVINNLLFLVIGVLDVGYWYTRTTTASISVPGTVFLALGKLFSAASLVAGKVEDEKMRASFSNLAQILWLVVFTAAMRLFLPGLMLKTIWRVEATFLEKTSSWIPTIRRLPPTHRERQSQRTDQITSWAVRIQVFLTLVALYSFFSPEEYFVLSGQLPPQTADDHPQNLVSRLSAFVIFPLTFTGTASQLLLNHRMKMFAGAYKLAVILRFVAEALRLATYSTSLVGRFDAKPGLSIPAVVDLLLLGMTIWQATRFPKVGQSAEDEDTEE
ncbi:hypothetical protein HMN09_01202500 [Mycena chlorophos]|uniref:Uncharacterized protein n=1 Tax=Mycena chlorophos TaxID=658473 RepID=A0A8H6S6K0_MYCCL|nr:hypothetical protein HMN09_01202500 [Mycena chlorophos]